MDSYVVFCYEIDLIEKGPIKLYLDDERVIDTIIQEAINNNYIDLSNYYPQDAMDSII